VRLPSSGGRGSTALRWPGLSANLAAIGCLSDVSGCSREGFRPRLSRRLQNGHEIKVGIEAVRQAGPGVGPVPSNRLQPPRWPQGWAIDPGRLASCRSCLVLRNDALRSPVRLRLRRAIRILSYPTTAT
jgi:hypothetical protein